MTCGYFLDGHEALCALVQGLMVPSLRERQAYCTSARQAGCPICQHYQTTGQRVALDVAAALLGVEDQDTYAVAGGS